MHIWKNNSGILYLKAANNIIQKGVFCMNKGKAKMKKNNNLKNNTANNSTNSSSINDAIKNSSIKELNAILKGEYMAIDAYKKYVDSISDTNAKTELQKIENEHKNQAQILTKRIQDLGGKAKQSSGVLGKVALTLSSVKDIGNNKPSSFVKKALNGESNGVKLVSEMVKGDLDSTSMNLVNSMLNQDKAHINTLSGLATSLEDVKK
jgi:bacterioferritin (cytochrome b1)